MHRTLFLTEICDVAQAIFFKDRIYGRVESVSPPRSIPTNFPEVGISPLRRMDGPYPSFFTERNSAINEFNPSTHGIIV